MEKPLKIVFLLEDLCYGGTQRQSLELASRLDKKRFAPEILSLSGPGDFDDFVKSRNLPLNYMGNSRGAAPLFFIKLRRYLQELQPDILIPCTALPNIWGRIWGRLLSIPVIIGTCRGGGAPKRQHERFLWRFSDHIICNSRQLVEVMHDCGVHPDRLSYIPNGIDTQFFVPNKNNKNKLIVCIARLAKDKDHKTLLKAFEAVLAKVPDARLRLVGDGPEAEHLHSFARKYLQKDTLDRLDFYGSSDNPLQHYQDASIFALSSVREGQPNAILEAMSCGLPVCATRVGGIPGLVKHQTTGFLSNPGDAYELANNMTNLLLQPEMGLNFGKAARRFVEENFSFAKMVDAHQNLFENIWKKNEKN